MKKLILLLCLIVGCKDNSQGTRAHDACPVVDVRFSPRGGAEEAIVAAINASQNSIFIQAYSFTAVNIAEALINAKKRGIDVVVIADREVTKNQNSVIPSLVEANIMIYIDSSHAIAHNKIMIIDNNIVLTGSYNFSKAASQHNAENLVSISDDGLAEIYFNNWKLHKEHSTLYNE